MNIEPTNLFKALKDQPAHEPPKPVTDEQKVEVANDGRDALRRVRSQ